MATYYIYIYIERERMKEIIIICICLLSNMLICVIFSSFVHIIVSYLLLANNNLEAHFVRCWSRLLQRSAKSCFIYELVGKAHQYLLCSRVWSAARVACDKSECYIYIYIHINVNK